MKPQLDKHISVATFKNYYWLKEELQQFCRTNDMSVVGNKGELTERIAIFLETGEKVKPNKKRKQTKTVHQAPLSLQTVITENHRCSQNVRAFFQSIIPKFHFSTHIQQYFRQHVGKTYNDVVNAWYEEEERKKDPNYRKDILPQFEYNRFIRDYFADPINKGKTREQAIKEWNIVKQMPGSNAYTKKV